VVLHTESTERMPRRLPAIANPTSSTALRDNNWLLHLVRSGSLASRRAARLTREPECWTGLRVGEAEQVG
jgi:hypothetical protein